ncbi:MAG: sigma-70 family RNA polymerase sigma factor [Vicinamibacterales bacterium]
MPPDLYSQHADVIEAALAYARRAHRLSVDAGDEFASWARLKLLDHDCAILQKFEGRSSLRTFLITVVQRLFLDWRNAEWGKWRPTADARRVGNVAIELERLITRDQMSFGEAVEMLVSRGIADSRDECEQVWAELPQRPSRRMTDDTALANVAAPGLASDDVTAAERRKRGQSASAALADALAALPAQDQLIVRLRFHDRFTVARIAELVGEDQKALYRRFERLLGGIRSSMTARGVSASDVADLLAHPAGELQPIFEGLVEDSGTRPSTKASAGGEHV